MRIRFLVTVSLILLMVAGCAGVKATQNRGDVAMKPIVEDTRIFKIDPEIQVKEVRFKNRFGIELAGHLYLPKKFNTNEKYAAIAVCGPFGAVKEQSSGLYAQELAGADLLHSPLTPPIPVRVPVSRGMWLPPILIPRTSLPRWIFSRCNLTSIPGKSAFWVSAAGAVWRLMLPLTTRGLKRQLLLLCTI